MNERLELQNVLPVLCEVIESGGVFNFYPRGTSMLPTLSEARDSVSLAKPEKLSKGDIVLYRRKDGAFVLHRIISAKNGVFTMRGDNQTFCEKGVTADMIIAKVESYTHKGKTVKNGSAKYRFHYVFAFTKAFSRKYIFGVLRKIKKLLTNAN